MAIYNRGEKKRFAGIFSRTKQRIANNLGIIDAGGMNSVKKFRDDKLELYDSYYENRQYDGKIEWDDAAASDEYVPIRSRKPRIKYNLAKVIVDRVAAKLVGESVWPKFNVENDPDSTEFFQVVQKITGMKHELMEPVKRSLASGSAFVRYFVADGTIQIESYQSKYCYPQFQPNGELGLVEIKYIYLDPDDKDGLGNPKKKWFRMDIGMDADIEYDNPEYKEGSPEPEFTVVERVDHGLGFVQGEWLRTKKKKFTPDGDSLYGDILDFIDEFCYSLSQSSQAVGYNQDPQLVLNNMDEEEIDALIRSATKAWNLGREGKAELLEGGMDGVKAAGELRTGMQTNMVNVARVVMLDPDKIVGSAQSGKAMEVLHGPLVELIDELRPRYEHSLKALLIKMGLTLLEYNNKGFETALIAPPNYMPTSLDITLVWPPLFPLTLEDLQKKVAAAVAAKNGNIISVESALRFIAKDFGVEDIEEELKKIESDMKAFAALNPYNAGGF